MDARQRLGDLAHDAADGDQGTLRSVCHGVAQDSLAVATPADKPLPSCFASARSGVGMWFVVIPMFLTLKLLLPRLLLYLFVAAPPVLAMLVTRI